MCRQVVKDLEHPARRDGLACVFSALIALQFAERAIAVIATFREISMALYAQHFQGLRSLSCSGGKLARKYVQCWHSSIEADDGSPQMLWGDKKSRSYLIVLARSHVPELSG